MGNLNEDQGREAGETEIRGKDLEGSERSNAPDHLRKQQARATDKVIRTDGEKDELYNDGLDLEDESSPLTGINGKDDSE